jgi:hypothetical protein
MKLAQVVAAYVTTDRQWACACIRKHAPSDRSVAHRET